MRSLSIPIAAAGLWLASMPVMAAPQAASQLPIGADPVEAAISHTRNLEYDVARQQLEAWVSKHPGDLRALNYLASTITQRQLFEREAADGRLNSGNSSQGNPPVSEAFRKDLYNVLLKAEAAASGRLKLNPNDQDALYWDGFTHLVRAVFEISFAKSNTGALREAREARNFHARLLGLNPGYVDAMLLPGMYDYIAGSIPWYMKILTAIIGIHGDKQRGLASMERVARDGNWAKVEAREFLAVFYYREKRYGEAIALMEQVARDYPRNFVVLQHIARTYKTEGNWQRAAETYELILTRYRAGEPGYQNVPAAKILYQAGEAYAHFGDLEHAQRLYAEAEKRNDDSIFVYRAALAAGGVDQQQNRLDEARRRYQRVASAVPATDEGRAARLYLKKLQ
jgi:tetratricopeptide (TPR) repeat protein